MRVICAKALDRNVLWLGLVVALEIHGFGMGEVEKNLPGPAESDPDLIFVEDNDRYRLSLRLDAAQMECIANIELSAAESSLATDDHTDDEQSNPQSPGHQSAGVLTPAELIWFLQQNNIVQTVDYAAVYEFCAALETGLAVEPTVLARGIDPVAGRDGWFELLVKTTGEESEFRQDEKGNVDLRTLNAYSEIEPGQKLGIVHPPGEGIAGMTVQGCPVAAEAGRTFALIAGEGVVLKYDNRAAFAEKAGRAIFEKDRLSVVDQLVIPGDLDMSIGNIDFHGFVEIKGEVPDDFVVRATKGIKIGGLVGACKLESQGSIEITSMAGKEVGRIDCHGDLRAAFLNQVEAAVYGDIVVTNEIRNSYVKSTGKIIVERGSIIGGRCTAMNGVEAKTLGTASGQKTQIIAGVFFPDIERFVYLRGQLQNINRQIESVAKALGPLKKMLSQNKGVSEAAALRLRILNEQLDKLHDDKNRFAAEIKASQPQQFNCQNPKINVLKTLMEGVFITLGDTVEEIKIQRRGPMSIIENTQDGGLRYLDLSPLQVMAQDIEESLLPEEAPTAPGLG
ncbi:MAG: DUF342 domain-containing protein [Desulfuromonadales bacterium]|nr:DUF342 domain-containing protein [Desulfuromonadales bacterium]MBN2792139.1 DUF342 domain-containing protein [Desulfuromonadales bacterium]